ncbi:MAG: glycosyltransferase family 2 protein [Bacteroidetes bacterium]|nr:glycosyltransferase family 2 protein [Bacteroidota bacterium]
MNSQPGPSVSIVLATYNGEKYLREQLDSLFAQTYPLLEIIAVDDCSSDSTIAILKEYAAAHPILQIYQNEVNLKHNRTFERGIQLAKGDCIAMCDQDDIWLPEKISTLMEQWSPESLLIHCDSEFIDAEGKSLQRKISDIKNLQTYSSPIPFIIGNTVAGHAAIFRKELIKSILPFPSIVIHDWWMAFVAATQGPVQYVDEPLIHYRQHAGNVIGAIKVKGQKKKKDKSELQQRIRERMKLFSQSCPEHHSAKNLLNELARSYSSFGLSNNFLRMNLFFTHQEQLLATKNRSPFRKWLFCVKMFFTVQ